MAIPTRAEFGTKTANFATNVKDTIRDLECYILPSITGSKQYGVTARYARCNKQNFSGSGVALMIVRSWFHGTKRYVSTHRYLLNQAELHHRHPRSLFYAQRYSLPLRRILKTL